jgi:protease IV
MSLNQEGQSRSVEATVQKIVLYLIIIAAAVVGGYYLAVALVPTPKIGIISLQTQVNGLVAELMAQEIKYAIETDDIKGVVLVVDSPGGSASAGHDIYYQMRKLRDTKPVVVSMDSLAASAAYQISIAGNEIYAKPASLVGNIGVIVGLPQPEVLSERFITTGPFKATAFSTTGIVQKLDLLYANFRDSVVTERSAAPNPLKLDPDQVATGEIWVGLEAKEFGLIDKIGSLLDAIDRAGQLAHVEHYEVVDVREEYLSSLDAETLTAVMKQYEALDSIPAIDLTSEQSQWPMLYEMYIPLE